MKNNVIKLLLVFCLAISCVSFARDISHDEALKLREQGEILALENIINIAIKKYPDAKLLEVELEHERGVYQYEVELLTRDGIVRELEIDAKTGEVLVDEED